MSLYTFKWPSGPNEVVITGTFDNWSKTLPLVKQADGSFELTVPLPTSEHDILYKYVVDGEWLVNESESKASDESGNQNNVVEKSALFASSEKAVIPESGLPVTTSKDVKTTVLPREEPSHPTIAGEPGIVIPQDAAAIAAFSEVSTVDPKSLNGETAAATTTEELTAEEKKKQKKKVKKSKYKAKKKQQKKAGEEAEGSTEEVTSATATPEPETAPVEKVAEVAAPAAVVAATTAVTSEANKKAAVVEDVPVPNVEEPKEPAVVAAQEATHEFEERQTLDPKAQHPEPTIDNGAVEDKEVTAVQEEAEAEAAVPEVEAAVPEEAVTAANIAATSAKKEAEEEEIIITKGVKNPEAAIQAQEGDVSVEEIKPTESEAKNLQKRAEVKTNPAVNAAKNAASAAKADVKKVASTPVKEEKKKGFFSKLKKIFK